MKLNQQKVERRFSPSCGSHCTTMSRRGRESIGTPWIACTEGIHFRSNPPRQVGDLYWRGSGSGRNARRESYLP